MNVSIPDLAGEILLLVDDRIGEVPKPILNRLEEKYGYDVVWAAFDFIYEQAQEAEAQS